MTLKASVKYEVLFKPFPKQEEFIKAVFSGRYRVVLYGGGIRGGKTYAGLGTLLLLCKKYPKSRWAIVRDTLPTLKRNTIPSFNKICPQSFIKSYNQDTQVVTFTNDSQILFFSENYDDDKELNRWKGLEVNGFLIEECNELQQASFYKAIERAGAYIPPIGYTKPPPLIMMTCNPANNWVKDMFYDASLGRDGKTLPPEWLFINAKITDNPAVTSDEAYMESLKLMPFYEYQKYVLGDWDIQLKTGGEFYKCFNLDNHVGKCVYDPSKPLHISFDENYRPYFPLGIFQMSGKHVYMIDYIAANTPDNNIDGICKQFERKYPNHNSGLFIYGDATSKKGDVKLEKGHNFFTLILDKLSRYKPSLRIPKSNPSVVMRGSFINAVFEKEIFDCKFTIDENCKIPIADFINIKESKEGDKAKKVVKGADGVSYQEYGHFTDLTDYILIYLWSDEYHKYQFGEKKTPTLISMPSHPKY